MHIMLHIQLVIIKVLNPDVNINISLYRSHAEGKISQLSDNYHPVYST